MLTHRLLALSLLLPCLLAFAAGTPERTQDQRLSGLLVAVDIGHTVDAPGPEHISECTATALTPPPPRN